MKKEKEQKLDINSLINMLAKEQNLEKQKQKKFTRFIFNWENANAEFVEIIPNTRIYQLLNPIKFSINLALIIEAMHNNIDNIIYDREKTLETIRIALQVEEEYFYKNIKTIQTLLIKFKKVRICKNGRIIINEI